MPFVVRGCPQCDAVYHVVMANVGSEQDEQGVTCLACGTLLAGREGKFILKYFMLRPDGYVRGWKKRDD